jgi:SNF2 family DNA or RNA helicase
MVGGAKNVVDLVSALAPATGDGGQLMMLRRMLGIAKLRGATEYLIDMLDNLPRDRKVLVFAVHAHVIAALARHLGEYSPAVLVGTTSPKDRELAVDKFLNNPTCRVFIGNIQAAGTAITLVGPNCKCSDVVFVESSWTPADNAQAACRVHRIGQRDGVVARMLSATGTVDDLINDLLVRKAREFTQLFDQGEKT